MTMKLFDDDALFSQPPQRNCDDKNAALFEKKRSSGPVGKFTVFSPRAFLPVAKKGCFEPEASPSFGLSPFLVELFATAVGKRSCKGRVIPGLTTGPTDL